MPAPATATYHDKVFINCPFDHQYKPLMRAAVFTVYLCGFYPKSALEEDNGTDNRLDKIVKMIKESRYGIHDISRVQLDTTTNLPRFNMPFELGLYIGAKRFGNKEQKQKTAVIFDTHPFRYQAFISDLNGIDPKAHANNPGDIIRQIRNWLATESGRTTIPATSVLMTSFLRFEADLPVFLLSSGWDLNTITFSDLCRVIEKYLT